MSNSYQISSYFIDHLISRTTGLEFKILIFLYAHTVYGHWVNIIRLYACIKELSEKFCQALEQLEEQSFLEITMRGDEYYVRIRIEDRPFESEKFIEWLPISKSKEINKADVEAVWMRELKNYKTQYTPEMKVNSARKFKIQTRLRDSILKRDNYQCAYCGSKEYLTIDHIIPMSKNGSDDFSNLQTLCRSCNASKNNR